MPRLFFAVIAALATCAHAVTPGDGPGGVGTTNGASELELWVKADALALPNGAPVTAWGDSSGNGRTLTPPTAATQPMLVTGALGGKPVVRFSADHLGSQTLPSANNEFTLVAVIKPVKTGSYQNIIDDENASRPMLWVDAVGNYEFNLNTGAVAPLGGGYDAVFAVKRNTGPPFSQLYLNGPAVSASGAADFTVAASEVYDLFNRDGTLSFTGDVAELIIYSTALSPEEIAKIGFYLQEKYSLPTNFPPPFPTLSGYDANPATYGVNVPIAPNAPKVAGGAPTGFSISPALPAGLNFDAGTGVISGTPTSVSPRTDYVVTARFASHPDSATQLSLEVTPPTLVGYTRNPATFTQGRVARAIQPIFRGAPAPTFTISPALPAGLILNSQTGEISGTPTASAASAGYTVTATSPGYSPSSFVLNLEVLEPSVTLDITEFMASNDSGLTDGDGERSDWVEIHNYGTTAIDLEGWSLTDSAGNLRRWVFPPHLLPAGAYLVVFASGDSHIDTAGNFHTDFRLEASGEYLALVQPDGTTIARQFAPGFPAQTEDVSFGTPDRVSYGPYPAPTPGAANGFFTSVLTTVSASNRGRAFTGTLTVSLSAALAEGAVIRYTLDGSAPSAASPVYSAPIALSANTHLRARVFQAGLDPGPELSEVYLKLGPDVQSFSSNLPLVFLHTDGAIAPGTSATLTGASAVIVSADGQTGRAAASGVPNYSGRSGLRIRGRSSASFPQKQYKFETWDATTREVAAPLLGLSSDSDWVLYAPYSDKSLVRNALAYRTWERLGWPSLGTRFVEVFINDDRDGQFTYADDYAGIYMLVESITLDRVGLNGPQSTTNAAEITGGFITETGNADDQDFSTTGSGRAVAHRHRDPDAGDLNATQERWIRDYIQEFERALYGQNFTHPTTGLNYRAYTNVASQVDYKIAREWSRNFDGGSTYSYVPRGGKLTMGPLWDYNWAFGNVNYAEGGDLPGYRTDGWNRSFTSNTNGWAPWWLRFEQDPDWWQQFIDRWTDLREGLFSDARVNADIDALTTMLAQEAATRHFTRWPQLGMFTVVSPPGYQTRTTYQSEVDYLKTWVRDRSAWIDSQFPRRPTFSRPGGQVPAGTAVTITAAAGQTIYYTTDGSDPRAPGGAINPNAASVAPGGSVTVNSSVLLAARAKSGTTWSAPASSAFVTGTAATAANLVISEFHYHPANPSAAELSVDPTLGDDDFEFIEVRNTSAGVIDLTGVQFRDGVGFTFPVGTTLAPGAYALVVENASAFALRHGGNISIAGQYTGNLDNSGDTIVLSAADGSDIARVRYFDLWTAAADGRGYALTLADPDRAPTSYSAPGAWALSGSVHGSPGTTNGARFTSDFSLWQRSTFSEADLANPQRSGLLADPDEDGASNLLEFASGTFPLTAGSHPGVDLRWEGNDLVFQFERRPQTLDLTYTVEESGDLVTWTPVSAPFEVVAQNGTTESVRVVMRQDAEGERLFRLRVTKAN